MKEDYGGRHERGLVGALSRRAVDGDLDLLRDAFVVLAEAVMVAESGAEIGASHSQRSTRHSVYRPRRWTGA